MADVSGYTEVDSVKFTLVPTGFDYDLSLHGTIAISSPVPIAEIGIMAINRRGSGASYEKLVTISSVSDGDVISIDKTISGLNTESASYFDVCIYVDIEASTYSSYNVTLTASNPPIEVLASTKLSTREETTIYYGSESDSLIDDVSIIYGNYQTLGVSTADYYVIDWNVNSESDTSNPDFTLIVTGE